MTPRNPAEFSITRVLDAPRERVWEAFTESERLMNWWGPKGFAMQVAIRGVPINATGEECKTFEAARDSVKRGFAGTLDQLADYLAKA